MNCRAGKSACFWLVVALWALIAPSTLAAGLAAPTKSPASQPTSTDEEPLRIDVRPNRLDPALTTGGAAVVAQNPLDIRRVGLALAIVLGSIFILRWIGRRIFKTPGNIKSGKGVQLLSRSVLAPKQQVLLLQVGKRLIVVGDSGGSMNALCEINDPDEVAGLVGQVNQDRPEIPNVFGALFRRAKEPFSGAVNEPPPPETVHDPEEAEIREEIGGLLDKVQMMRKQFKAAP